MGVEINLLPKETSRNKEAGKLVSLVNKLAIGAAGVFLLVVAAGSAFYFLTANRVSSMKEDQKTLTNNIKNLQSTEQSLILLRDRIQKSQQVLGSRIGEDAFQRQKEVFNNTSSDVAFDGSEIQGEVSSLDIRIANSRNLVNLFSSMVASGNFTTLIVNELSFDSVGGYLMNLNVR